MQGTAYADREVLVGSLKLHYQEWGDPANPPMILLHGFGVSGHMFDEFGQGLEGRYHMLCIDQRGHGDSDWSPDGDYSRDAFVADLEGFRSALQIEKFVLVGHSMGGLNAVTYAGRFPERVDRLILVDVGPEAVREGVDNIARFTRGPDNLEFEQYVEMAHQFNPRRSVENIRERMGHRLRPAADGKWTWKFDKRFRDSSSDIVVGSELGSEDTWALFTAVSTPTLLIRGSESDVLSQNVAEDVAEKMPTARLVVIPEAGHSVPGDAPEAFTEAALEFLSETIAPVVNEPTAEASREGEASARSGNGISAGHEALRSHLEESETPRPARISRERRGRGLLLAVGAAAVAATAVLLGIRSLRRRKSAPAKAKRRARRLRAVAGRETSEARDRAAATFDELTSLGRDRLAQALTSDAVVRTGVQSDTEHRRAVASPKAQGERRRRRPVRAVARFAGREAKKAGGIALAESQELLTRKRRRRTP